MKKINEYYTSTGRAKNAIEIMVFGLVPNKKNKNYRIFNTYNNTLFIEYLPTRKILNVDYKKQTKKQIREDISIFLKSIGGFSC